jgi:hypothetical protein
VPAEIYSYAGSLISQQVKEKFGDSGNVQITDSMILNWVNNGQRAIVQQHGYKEGVLTNGLIAGTNTYDLSASATTQRIMQIMHIIVNGQEVNIVPFAEYQALVNDRIQYTAGVPQAQAVGRPTVGAVFADILYLYPIPDITLTAGIQIFARVFPADLTAIADKLTVPDRFYNALFDYVMAQALELDENFQASQIKLGHFQAGIQRENDRSRGRIGEFYGSMVKDPYDEDSPYWAGDF